MPADAARPPIPFTIADERPRWEGHSKDCAIDFMAMEDCAPVRWQILADAVQQASAAWPDPPSRATLHLQSFRVVIKQPTASDDGDFRLPSLDKSSNSSVGGGVGAAILYMGILAAVVTVEGVYLVGRGLVEGVADCGRALHGPPDTLGDDYSSGVTCEVNGALVLHWSDGRVHTSVITGVVNNAYPDKEHGTYLGDDIAAVVQNAVWQMSQDWVRQISGPSPQR
jgi:hypothetical protein